MRWENVVEINAPLEVVWQLTVDVERWPSISPTMQRVELLDGGPLRLGSRARIKQPAQSATVWTVVSFAAEDHFFWQTRRLGMTMTGAHIVEKRLGRCRNFLSLEIQGRGSEMLGQIINLAIRRSLALENAGFKRAAERTANRWSVP